MSRAAVEAERLLEDLGLDKLPVDPRDVCEAMTTDQYRITISEEPFKSEQFHGISMGNAHSAAILVNKSIKNRHRRRFTAAHELGHVYLHIQTHKRSTFQCTSSDLSSGNSSKNRFEIEANEFASSLLMPASRISTRIHRRDLSWSLVEEIRGLCDVSLEAAARRITTLSRDACCLIIHKNGKMWFPFKSNRFVAFIPFQTFPEYLETDNDDNRETPLPETMENCDFDDWSFPESARTGSLYNAYPVASQSIQR